MQPIPVKVKNITVYAYFNPTEPLEEVVITGATGTYSVGTLITSIFYNLDLNDDGDYKNPLNIHGKYYATGETESGHKFTTPWMYCLDNSKTPKFGRTIDMLKSNDTQLAAAPAPETIDSSDYIRLSPLKNITVTQSFPPPAIGERELIKNGSGYIIATRTGTPHLMGVEVDSGERFGKLIPGMKLISITGTAKDGKPYCQTQLTIISAGEPAIFLRELF